VLLGDDDQAAAQTAIRLVAALYPSDTPFDPPPPAAAGSLPTGCP